MATIKFSAERMNEIHNRLGEIKQQLQTTLQADSDNFNVIAQNIQNESMANTLKTYASANIEKCNKILELIDKMNEFLQTQMAAYDATDAEAQSTIAEVQGILNQIDLQ